MCGGAATAQRRAPENPSESASVYWLPWLAQDELLVAMRNAACTVLPSITEGFGLAAAESISQGVATLYQQVGGHHGLPSLPNALPVPLTTTERAQLYGLWSELIGIDDFWPVWSRYEISLRPLVDKWVDAIRSVVYRADRKTRQIDSAQFPKPPEEERWGNRLRSRIELGGATVESCNESNEGSCVLGLRSGLRRDRVFVIHLVTCLHLFKESQAAHQEMASSLEHLAERWSRNDRPRLVHLMPWDLTVGGAQRMLDVWCSARSPSLGYAHSHSRRARPVWVRRQQQSIPNCRVRKS